MPPIRLAPVSPSIPLSPSVSHAQSPTAGITGPIGPSGSPRGEADDGRGQGKGLLGPPGTRVEQVAEVGRQGEREHLDDQPGPLASSPAAA